MELLHTCKLLCTLEHSNLFTCPLTLVVDCHRSSQPRDSDSIPLTGDPRADADIIAFYKARQKLIQKGDRMYPEHPVHVCTRLLCNCLQVSPADEQVVKLSTYTWKDIFPHHTGQAPISDKICCDVLNAGTTHY